MNKICTKNTAASNDSDTTTFKLSVINSAKPLLISLSVDRDKQSITVYHDGCDTKIEVSDCHGLLHFKQLLEKMERNTAIVPGHLSESSDGLNNTKIKLLSPSKSSEKNLIAVESVFFTFKPNKPALICFNVDGKGKTPDVAWDELCEIDPSLKKVGHLVTWSNSVFLQCSGGGKNRAVPDRYSFYCLVKDGGDVLRYSHAFQIQYGAKYRIWMEHCDTNEYSMRQFVHKQAFHPNNIIFKSPTAIEEDIFQENSLFQLCSGEILDTEAFSNPNILETTECLKNYTSVIASINEVMEASIAQSLHEILA